MARTYRVGIIGAFGLVATLAACEDGFQMPFAGANSPQGEAVQTAQGTSVEQDVEAPEVFAADETALWDGRPSLGGVWVAHPDVTDPERVMIRNPQSGASVVGALFRRERATPGPRIQVSSDAASELGLLAGQPTQLSVVALRREVIEIAPPPAPEALPLEVDGLPIAEAAAPEIEAQPLDPVAIAAAAVAATTPPEPRPAQAPAPALDRAFIQIGIFSVEQNAENAAASLRNIGIIPTIKPGQSQDKAFWRVIVGPSTSTTERRALLNQIRDLGYSDAYFVRS